MDKDTDTETVVLLMPTEPPAFEIVNPDGNSSAVLVCDHASSRVPTSLSGLGLEPHQLAQHIGWDSGAADVARRLSMYLDAPLLLSGYSRLVIDCNRPLHSKESIPQQSAGVLIPGNCELTPEQRVIRVNTLFQPYHQAIERLLDERKPRPTVLLSIHSFTPILNGQRRPWQIGVSHWRDARLAALMIRELTQRGALVVGHNQPYPIDDITDYTLPVHGEGRGLPSIMLEIRQDEIHTEAGATAYASRLAESYRRIEAEMLCLIAKSTNEAISNAIEHGQKLNG
jgi:predicted N-formylglutamate amidohydrolase